MDPGARTRFGGQTLPPDIYAGLVDTLFGTLASFLSGILGGLLVPAVAWLRTGEPIYLACASALIVLAAFRILVLLAYRRAPLESRESRVVFWERLYALGGIGFMTAVGLSSALLFIRRPDDLLCLYGVVIVLGCAGSLAGRNAGRPAIVMGQLLGVCLPTTLVLLTRFDVWYWGLAFIFLLVLTSVRSTTQFLNQMLVKALLSSREARNQGLALGTALNSMSHGLCMADHNEVLTVVNRRLLDFFDLGGATLTDFPALVDAIIVSTGLTGEDAGTFARAMRSYVKRREPCAFTQPLRSQVFLFRFESMDAGGSVMVVEDITEARRAAEQIERLAHFDPLTGLANRYEFLRQLKLHLEQSDAEPAALLGIDLDRFKTVNDTLGHHMGDRLLQQVANRLQQMTRKTDIVARFGGDEFQVLLRPCPTQAELDALAAGLVARISDPYHIEGHAISVGASIGIAIAPDDASTADALIMCADLALYSAKSAARGTYRYFVPELDAEAHRKRRIEIELRRALASGHLEVHYQPAIDVRTGRVSTFEALIRWRHPTRGLVSPGEFIPVAEETGLIAEIGEHVLERACLDALTWPEDIRVAVNVSPKQFLLRQDLPDRIQEILLRTGLPPHRLEVEITESMLIDSGEALTALAKTGVRVSLDDFGTGYSSLSYLRQFKFDKIKIDRSFVASQDRVSHAIIEAISFLARSMNVDLVAEGVETEDQLAFLADRGIFLIQGFLFSRPLPLNELDPFLKGSYPIRKVA